MISATLIQGSEDDIISGGEVHYSSQRSIISHRINVASFIFSE